jgi:hypothetical protein
MRKLSVLVPVLLVACAGGEKAARSGAAPGAPAAPTGATPVGAEQVAPTGQPLLWQVSSADGQQQIWLYGTIHTGGGDLVPKAAWDALDGSTMFVMETDLDSIDQQAFIKRGFLPAGDSLDKHLSATAWTTLVHAVAPQGVDEATLKHFKPWLAEFLVINAMVPKGEATDHALKRAAKEKGLALEYLETWQEQVDAVEKALDDKSLEQTLADLDGGKTVLGELVTAYKQGDVDAIVKLTTDPTQMTPEAADVMLYQRNKNWEPKLEAYLARGKVFVAVGAGHLPGPGGVLELLAKKGYKVERAK